MTFYEAALAVAVAAGINLALIAYLVVRRLVMRPTPVMMEARSEEYASLLDAIAVSDEPASDEDVRALSGARRWERDLLTRLVTERVLLVTGGARSRLVDVLDRTGVVDERIKELEHPSVWKRRLAADALGRSYSERAISPLTLALRDTDPDVRSIAAKALGRFEVVSAIPYIVSLIRDLSEDLCAGIADTVIWFGVDAVGPLLAEIRRSEEDSDGDRVRYWCATCVANIGSPSDADGDVVAAEALKPLLADPSDRVRRVAALALGNVGTARDAEALMPLLSDSERRVRCEAALALGRLRDPGTTEALLELFKEPDFDVSTAAGDALAEFGETGLELMRGYLRSVGRLQGAPATTEVGA